MAKSEAGNAPFDYAGQWDDVSESEELTLPSGKLCRVSSPNMPTLAKQGLIPNHLLPVVERFVLNGQMKTLVEFNPAIAEGEVPGAALMRAAELNDYIAFFCVAAVVTPKLSLDGAPGTIAVTKISPDDQFAIWDWGAGISKALAAFRGDGEGALVAVEPAPDGGEVREEPERIAGADEQA